jgi:ribosomal-protein-alanine N-acetyltransferase
MELETSVFATDHMSRRTLKNFLSAKTAVVLVAHYRRRIAAAAVVLFRANSKIARLYSIAVAPRSTGRGVGPALLTACENTVVKRGCQRLRLEVHERNRRAIAFYRKAGYRRFGRYDEYYRDGGHALRFEKALTAGRRAPASFG